MKIRPRKKHIIAFFIIAHFSLIVFSLIDPKFSGNQGLWKALRFYGKWTGATASYSFFSPEIPREIVFSFTIHFADGTTKETTLQETANNEVNARVGNILRLFAKNFKKKEIIRSLAASITASMFEAYPNAEKIEIRGSLHKFPSMAAYREGERATFLPVYQATFRRGRGEQSP